MKVGGITATELKAEGKEVADLFDVYTLVEMEAALFEVADFVTFEKADNNKNIADLVTYGIALSDLLSSYSITEMKAGNISATQLKDEGKTVADLKADYSVSELLVAD